MPRNTLLRIYSISKLNDAWYSFWRENQHQRSSGVDGLTVAEFKRHESELISDIHERIRRGGYDFSPLKPIPIKKSSGADRIICIPTVSDRLVQRIMSEHLSGITRLRILNDTSFGFIRGRGVIPARARALSLRERRGWVFKSDISAFFDKVDRRILISVLDKRLRSPSLMPIIRSAVQCEIQAKTSPIRRTIKSAGIQSGVGIRQGMPLSPVFANILLADFDSGMKSAGFEMVRYADDFIVFCDSRAACEAAEREARELLESISLEIPQIGIAKSKSVIAQPAEPVEFLGLSLEKGSTGRYSLVLPVSHIEKIQRHIQQYCDVDFLISERLNLAKASKKVLDIVSGYAATYSVAENFDRDLSPFLLRAPTFVTETVIDSAFGSGACAKLSPKYRQFLGLEAPRVRKR